MVYDIWFHPASYHEVRSLRIRHKMSKWFRFLTDIAYLMLLVIAFLEEKVNYGSNFSSKVYTMI
jgi:hypothetical protein